MNRFNAQSATVFADITAAQNTVSQALTAVAAGFSGYNSTTGTFGKPAAGQMEWKKTVKSSWKAREDRKAEELKVKKINEKYDGEDAIEDVNTRSKDIKNYATEVAGQQFEKISKTALKDGKNIGKIYAAKLQPRDAKGRFIKDTNPTRRAATSKLKGITNAQSKTIGKYARVGGGALIAYNYYADAKEHYDEYHNVGRAMSYSAVTTTTGVVAGAVGATAGTAIAIGLGATATSFAATIGAPVFGAVLIGAVAVVGVKTLYKNVKPVKTIVDGIGDSFNEVGKAFSKSFSWN